MSIWNLDEWYAYEPWTQFFLAHWTDGQYWPMVGNPPRLTNPVHWMVASWQRSSGLRTTICWTGSEAPCLWKGGTVRQDCESVLGLSSRCENRLFPPNFNFGFVLACVLTTQVPSLQVVRRPLAKLDTMPLRKIADRSWFSSVLLSHYSHAFCLRAGFALSMETKVWKPYVILETLQDSKINWNDIAPWRVFSLCTQPGTCQNWQHGYLVPELE